MTTHETPQPICWDCGKISCRDRSDEVVFCSGNIPRTAETDAKNEQRFRKAQQNIARYAGQPLHRQCIDCSRACKMHIEARLGKCFLRMPRGGEA